MINVVLIDDERLAVENLAFHLRAFQDVTVVGAFNDQALFMKFLSENKDIDVVFMDIEMPGKTGLELAQEVIELYPKIQIVFVTAYSQYAIEAFELNAIDYCLKPVSKVRLERTIDKIKERMPQDPQTKVFIRCFGGFDIYVNGKLLNFNLSKAKELLAYLVNNQGKSIGWMAIADDIWPDALDDKKLMNNFHVACFSLRTFLANNNIGDIFEYSRNVYRVNTEKFTCDFYELIDTYRNYKQTGELKYHPTKFKTGDYFENLPYTWSYSNADKVEQMIAQMEKASPETLKAAKK
ncbi:MAG: response regulator [Bacilli bacterium]|nr:response regulator [Bacilli bacterium]